MQENTSHQAVPSPTAQIVNLQELPQQAASGPKLLDGNLAIISGVKVKIEVIAGTAELSIGELFSLQAGSVVNLDQLKDAPLAVRLDGRIVAQGNLVVMGDSFGIRISDVLPLNPAATE
jgi:flagellar motor switch protein FliN/FliY